MNNSFYIPRAWFLSLSITMLQFSYGMVYIVIIHHILSNFSLVAGHLTCFQVGVIINKASVNIHLQIF